MSVTDIQYTTLFLGTFGKTVEDVGLDLDTSGPTPVARKADHVVSLLVINDKCLEWQIDGKSLTPFELNGRDTKSTNRKANALSKLMDVLA
jgi:hypothetical protein